MKPLPSAVLALCLSSSWALGAEVLLPSKIDAVDLHLDSAEVTRTAHWSLPAGDTSIVLRGLSPRLAEQSLRLSGLGTDGVSIRSVSTRRGGPNKDPTTSPTDQALIDEQADLRARLDALEAKQAMIRNVAAAKPTVEIGASVSAPPDYWPSLWAKVADGLEETDHRMRETRKRLDVVTATLVDQVRAVTPIASDLDVVVDVSAEHAVEGDMTLVYQVVGPTWQPLYDARLRTDRKPAQLDLVRRARIDQSSGEDWSDVVLTLSTASLSSGTAAPTLNETNDATGDSRQGIVASRPVATGTSPIRTPTHIERTTTPYDARLQVPGRLSIASGSKARLISLGMTRTDVYLVQDALATEEAGFPQALDRLALLAGNGSPAGRLARLLRPKRKQASPGLGFFWPLPADAISAAAKLAVHEECHVIARRMVANVLPYTATSYDGRLVDLLKAIDPGITTAFVEELTGASIERFENPRNLRVVVEGALSGDEPPYEAVLAVFLAAQRRIDAHRSMREEGLREASEKILDEGHGQHLFQEAEGDGFVVEEGFRDLVAIIRRHEGLRWLAAHPARADIFPHWVGAARDQHPPAGADEITLLLALAATEDERAAVWMTAA